MAPVVDCSTAGALLVYDSILVMDKLTLKDKQEKRSIFYQIGGISLVIIGFLGIILPILPGWPFIFLGLFLIGGMPLIDQKILKYIPKKFRDRIFNPKRFEKKP
jgi:hypothetical protein